MEQSSHLTARRIPNEGRGRPCVAIVQEKIEFLRDLHLSWEKIASLFGVCRKTLYNIRSSYGMIESNDSFNFTTISDEQLCEKAMKIKHDMPEIGYNMLRGVLRAQGIHVSISRVQQCLSQIDPVNTALRWATPTSRRQYTVPYPNFIWHLDGNHKLIRYGRFLKISYSYINSAV